MPKDPYSTLGVARDAPIEDIKSAYRRMSKEWHPDKHPSTGSGQARKEAENRFKEINEAYETLSDPKKRQMYDQLGTVGGQGSGPGFGGFDFSGFTQGMPDLGAVFESFFGGRSRPTDNREEGGDEEMEVTVELSEVVAGGEREVRLKTFERCAACDGGGSAPGATIITCSGCNGTGQVTRTMQSFFGTIQQRTVCPRCRGAGKVPSKPCPECGGEGRRAGHTTVRIRIPPGISDGQTLKIRGEGQAGRRGGVAGDLYVTVRVRSDARFEREGADVHSPMTINVLDALLGNEIAVETVHGPVTLRVPEGTQPGQVFRVKGKGLPVLGTHRLGDHYVTVAVEIPKKLSRAERKLVEEWRAVR